MQKYEFYKVEANTWRTPEIKLKPGYYVKVWTPKLLSIAPKKLLTPTFLTWWLFHWSKIFKNSHYKIILIYTHERKLVHYTVILPAHFRFPFMQDGDVQIGPLSTVSDHRRNGLALYALGHIAKEYRNTHRNIWYVVRKENEPSIRLIEKYNFIKAGEGIKLKKGYTKLFGKFIFTKKAPGEQA